MKAPKLSLIALSRPSNAVEHLCEKNHFKNSDVHLIPDTGKHWPQPDGPPCVVSAISAAHPADTAVISAAA
jgi:hypothetical protein